METWTSVTRAETPFLLKLSDDTIEWQDSGTHAAELVDFFKRHNPFDELQLPDQVHLLHALCQKVAFKHDPGQQINDIIAFWKNYPQLLISDKTFSFETKITDVSKWKLQLNKNGLTWHDLSRHYSETKRIIEQNFVDFWFFGPLYPLPSLEMRAEILAILKEALIEVGYPYLDTHFPLINYPTFIMGPQWEVGDYIASNFVIMREYGIEDGRQNFHDGLVFLNFKSFEHCITRHDIPEYNLSKEIVSEIREIIRVANPWLTQV